MPDDVARFIRYVLALAAVLLVAGGVAIGRYLFPARASDAAVDAATVRVQQADSARAEAGQAVAALQAKVDTVRVTQRVAAAKVIVLDGSTLGIQYTPSGPHVPTPIPPQVVDAITADRALIASQGAEIVGLRLLLAADTLAFEERDRKIALLETRQAPRCSTKCGVVIGVATAIIAPKVVPKIVDAIKQLSRGGG